MFVPFRISSDGDLVSQAPAVPQSESLAMDVDGNGVMQLFFSGRCLLHVSSDGAVVGQASF